MFFSDIINLCALCNIIHVVINIVFDFWKGCHGTSILVPCFVVEITRVQIIMSISHYYTILLKLQVVLIQLKQA